MNEHKWSKHFKMELKHDRPKAYKMRYKKHKVFIWFNEIFNSYVCTLHKPKNITYQKLSLKEAYEFVYFQNKFYHEMIKSFSDFID